MKPNPRVFYPGPLGPLGPVAGVSDKTLEHLNEIIKIIKNKGPNRTKGRLILGHRYRWALGALVAALESTPDLGVLDFEGKSFYGWPIVWVLDDDNYLDLTQ